MLGGIIQGVRGWLGGSATTDSRSIRPGGAKSASTSMSDFFARENGAGSSFASYYRTPADYVSSFETANYVANIVGIIASDISKLEFSILDRKNEHFSNPKIEAFLASPCSSMSLIEFLQQSVQHLLLDGNVFWAAVQENLAQVATQGVSYFPVNPGLVRVYAKNGLLVSAGTATAAYEVDRYDISGNGTPLFSLPPEKIIHTKTLGPKNAIRGMGKIQQNANLLDADRLTSIFNNQFFAQGAKIPFILMLDEDFSPSTWDRVVASMEASTRGVSNWMRYLTLPFKAQIKELTSTHADLQYLEQRKFTRQEIREIFQVPSIILGGNEARYDSSEEQLRAYYGFTLPRYAAPIQQALTTVVRKLSGRNDISFAFHYPNVYRLDSADKLFDRGGLTPNQYRELFGLKPDNTNPELDRYYIGAQYLPIEVSNQPPSLPQSASGKNAVIGEKSERQLRIHRRATRSKRRSAKLFESGIKSFYRAMEARVLGALKSVDGLSLKDPGPDLDEIFNFEDERAAAIRAGKSLFTSAVTVGVTDANELFGTDVDSSTRNQKIVLVVERLNKRYADRTIDSRREDVRGILSSWRESGEPISELSGQLKDYFRQLTGENAWMATRIARTEASHAWDQASILSYDELGVETFDVVGCEDDVGDCNATGVPRSQVENLVFHPNHTGTLVPA